MSSKFVLTLLCPDRPGIVYAVSRGLLEVGGNITENAQFGDDDTELFCMRTEFEANTDDVNAVRNAIGVRPTEIPLRPDRVLALLRGRSAA